jgi:hypothetical protein
MNHFARIAVTICLVGFSAPFVAWAKGPFQGSFTSQADQELRLKQVGNRVCGEWSAEIRSRSLEGLVAGTISAGVLTLTWCSDQETTCSPALSDPYSKPDQFVAKPGRIERVRGNGDGSNQIFMRTSSALPQWSNAQSVDKPEFLEVCKW